MNSSNCPMNSSAPLESVQWVINKEVEKIIHRALKTLKDAGELWVLITNDNFSTWNLQKSITEQTTHCINWEIQKSIDTVSKLRKIQWNTETSSDWDWIFWNAFFDIYSLILLQKYFHIDQEQLMHHIWICMVKWDTVTGQTPSGVICRNLESDWDDFSVSHVLDELERMNTTEKKPVCYFMKSSRKVRNQWLEEAWDYLSHNFTILPEDWLSECNDPDVAAFFTWKFQPQKN